jgi:hypothetical protein
MVDPIHARHTATMIPGAELVLLDGHGHFSIEAFVIAELERIVDSRRGGEHLPQRSE